MDELSRIKAVTATSTFHTHLYFAVARNRCANQLTEQDDVPTAHNGDVGPEPDNSGIPRGSNGKQELSQSLAGVRGNSGHQSLDPPRPALTPGMFRGYHNILDIVPLQFQPCLARRMAFLPRGTHPITLQSLLNDGECYSDFFLPVVTLEAWMAPFGLLSTDLRSSMLTETALTITQPPATSSLPSRKTWKK